MPHWRRVLSAETAKPYFKELEKFVAAERKEHTVFPPEPDVFNAAVNKFLEEAV